MATNIKVSLHNLLLHHYPNYKAFFKNLESKTARYFFHKFPTPDLLKGIDETALTKELKNANNSIRKSKAAEILSAVKTAGYWENEYQEERNDLIHSYINSLNRFIKEIKRLEQKLDMLIAVTGYPLQTIDGVDTVLAATFIAHIGDINRFPNSNKIAKIAGIAPIGHSSGETKKQYANKLGNRELNKAFYSLALTQIRKDINPIMYEYYQKKIKEGRKKKHAMVFVERRLVNIVYRIMKDKRPYEPPIQKEKVKAVGQ